MLHIPCLDRLNMNFLVHIAHDMIQSYERQPLRYVDDFTGKLITGYVMQSNLHCGVHHQRQALCMNAVKSRPAGIDCKSSRTAAFNPVQHAHAATMQGQQAWPCPGLFLNPIAQPIGNAESASGELYAALCMILIKAMPPPRGRGKKSSCTHLVQFSLQGSHHFSPERRGLGRWQDATVYSAARAPAMHT